MELFVTCLSFMHPFQSDIHTIFHIGLKKDILAVLSFLNSVAKNGSDVVSHFSLSILTHFHKNVSSKYNNFNIIIMVSDTKIYTYFFLPFRSDF